MQKLAFFSMCVVLALYSVFKVNAAYTSFAAEKAPSPPAPTTALSVITRTTDPIGDADAYAMSQLEPASGKAIPPSDKHGLPARPLFSDTPGKSGSANDELLKLLSEH